MDYYIIIIIIVVVVVSEEYRDFHSFFFLTDFPLTRLYSSVAGTRKTERQTKTVTSIPPSAAGVARSGSFRMSQTSGLTSLWEVAENA